ncbi:MAG: thioredoxin, partial [Candidatus Altiarchaeales archaeon]|nr:thioredoxin [Candidatus Altiarchaeales archaeon]
MTEDINEIRKKRLKQMQKQYTTPSINSPVELADDSFKDFLSQHPKVVVDFWAPWCGPCKMIAPTLDELAQELAGQVAFGKVNVDENQNTAAEHGIMSIPTLI